MMGWKMIFLFQGCILRFHVNLPGCKKGHVAVSFDPENGGVSLKTHGKTRRLNEIFFKHVAGLGTHSQQKEKPVANGHYNTLIRRDLDWNQSAMIRIWYVYILNAPNAHIPCFLYLIGPESNLRTSSAAKACPRVISASVTWVTRYHPKKSRRKGS